MLGDCPENEKKFFQNAKRSPSILFFSPLNKLNENSLKVEQRRDEICVRTKCVETLLGIRWNNNDIHVSRKYDWYTTACYEIWG